MTRSLPLAYPAIMAVAMVAAWWLGRGSRAALGLAARERLGIALGAFCGAMIAAKLPFALADWDGLRTGRAWLDPGKTLVLGLPGGYLGVEIAKWALHVNTRTGDTFAVPVPVAVGIGRLGCFVGGCCYGQPTARPWGVDFGDKVLRHPTQLYESAFHLTAAVVLAVLRRWGVLRGQLIKVYIIAYMFFRFGTEFLRPEPRVFLGLTGYQVASVVLAVVFAGLLVRDRDIQSRTSDFLLDPGPLVPENLPALRHNP